MEAFSNLVREQLKIDVQMPANHEMALIAVKERTHKYLDLSATAAAFKNEYAGVAVGVRGGNFLSYAENREELM
jgi:hypothetical protein